MKFKRDLSPLGPLFCVVDGDHDDHDGDCDGGDDGNGGGDGDRDDIASMSPHRHHRRFCTYIG